MKFKHLKKEKSELIYEVIAKLSIVDGQTLHMSKRFDRKHDALEWTKKLFNSYKSKYDRNKFDIYLRVFNQSINKYVFEEGE